MGRKLLKKFSATPYLIDNLKPAFPVSLSGANGISILNDRIIPGN
jgi:hypothetical protein